MMAKLATLPCELLEAIALRLSTKERTRLLCASKQLGACLGRCGTLWEYATLAATSPSQAQSLLPWLLRRRDQLRELALSLDFPGTSGAPLTDEGFWCSALLGAGLFGSRLRSLDLHVLGRLELGAWLLALPELSDLSAYGAHVVVLPEFAQLTSLTAAMLVNCEAPLEGDDSDDEPDPFDFCLPASLRGLSLSFPFFENERHLPPALGECTRLEELELYPGLEDFKGLEKLSTLTRLTLWVSGSVPSELGALSALRQLCITSLDIRDEQELEPLCELTCLEKLSLLDTLEGDEDRVNEGTIDCPLPAGLLALPRLKELYVCFAFPPPYLAAPPLHLTTLASLEVLTLNISTAAKSLPALKILTALTSLKLYDDMCPEPPDAASLSALFDTLGSSLGSLRWLEIELCLDWDGQGLGPAGMVVPPALKGAIAEEGHEAACVAGALAGPVHLAKPTPPSFPALQHLELSAFEVGPPFCPAGELTTVVRLPERIAAMPSLQVLRVRGNIEELCSVLAAAAPPGAAVENRARKY